MNKIIHLTHTYVPTDSRILKEINSVSALPNCRVYGIGVKDIVRGVHTKKSSAAHIDSVYLWTRRLRSLPGIIRHILVALEMWFKMFVAAAKIKPRVVHCHDTAVLPVGLLLKLFFRSKLIYDAHELESRKNGISTKHSHLILFLEKMCWPFIDLFISVSPSILDWYDSKLGRISNILILNSPIINDEISSNRRNTGENNFRKIYHIDDDKRVFLYLGMLAPGRGIEKILDAFSSSMITSHVVFVGFGDFAEKITNAAKANTRIHLHPPVPHEEVVEISKNADFGLCIIENISLSDYFCLPNKLFEYAFAGIPILASNFPDMSRIVKEFGLGECCDIDSLSIRKAIQTMEESDYLLDKARLQELSWATQSERLKHAYQRLLVSPAGV